MSGFPLPSSAALNALDDENEAQLQLLAAEEERRASELWPYLQQNHEQLTDQANTVLQAAQNGENAGPRLAAEKWIEETFNAAADQIVFALMCLLRSNKATTPVRSLAAILLRQKLPQGDQMLFGRLITPIRKFILQQFLEVLTHETEDYVLRQVTDTVAVLGGITLPDEEWPEFFDFFFKMASSNNEKYRFLSYYLLSKLCVEAAEALTLKEIYPHITKMISAGLQSQQPLNIREYSVVAACKLIPMLDEDDNTGRSPQAREYQKFLESFFAILHELISSQQTQIRSASRVFSALTDLATDEAEFFKPKVDAIFTFLYSVGTAPNMELVLRQYALELMGTLTEGFPPMVRKSEEAMKQAFGLALGFVLQTEGDAEWCAIKEVPDEYEVSLMSIGEIGLDRLASSLEGPKTQKILLPMLQQCIISNNWKERHAALIAFAQCGEMMIFEQMPIERIIQSTADEHPRVRWAAADCIGQLAREHCPNIQTSFHSTIIPALTALFGDSAYPRNQFMGCAALAEFLEGMSEELMSPYTNQIVQTLVKLLNNSIPMVQEEALVTMSAICSTEPTAKQYYSSIVPMLKPIIFAHQASKEYDKLRARAIETLTMVGMHAGRELFSADCHELMKGFAVMLRDKREDDTLEQYILGGITRICSTLKEDFTVYLPQVMPIVFGAIKKPDDYTKIRLGATGLGRQDEEEDLNPLTVARLQSGDFYIHMEDKSASCSMVNAFCHDLGEAYWPWVAQTADIMLPLMDFNLRDAVKEAAIGSAPLMVECGMLALAKGSASRGDVLTLVHNTVKTLEHCVSEERTIEFRSCFAGAFRDVINTAVSVAGECINDQLLTKVLTTLVEILKTSEQSVKNRQEVFDRAEKGELEIDEEYEDHLAKQDQAEEEMNFFAAETIGGFVKSHRKEFLRPFCESGTYAVLGKLLDQKVFSTCRKMAVYIFDDIFEFIGEPAVFMLQSVVPYMLENLLDDDATLRQPCAYGLGVCAEKFGQHFAPYVDAAVKQLLSGLQLKLDDDDPSVIVEDYGTAHDNMLLALSKIIFFQNRPALVPDWLKCLPVLNDDQEGPVIYNMLINLMTQALTSGGVPALLAAFGGEGNSAHLLQVLLFAFKHRTVGNNDELNGKIGMMVAQLMLHSPFPEAYEHILKSLPKDKKKKKKAATFVEDEELDMRTLLENNMNEIRSGIASTASTNGIHLNGNSSSSS